MDVVWFYSLFYVPNPLTKLQVYHIHCLIHDFD